jgi:hypothetical protein
MTIAAKQGLTYGPLSGGKSALDVQSSRSIAWCPRFFTLYGAFLVKGKFPHTLLSIWLGVGEALASILGMKDPLLGRAERSIPAARRGAPLGARD